MCLQNGGVLPTWLLLRYASSTTTEFNLYKQSSLLYSGCKSVRSSLPVFVHCLYRGLKIIHHLIGALEDAAEGVLTATHIWYAATSEL